MHIAEHSLYWRIKIADGKWKFVPAHIVPIEFTGGGDMAMVSLPPGPPVEDEESE